MFNYISGNILLWLLSCIMSLKRGMWSVGRKFGPPISPYTDMLETEKRLTAYRHGLASNTSLFEFVKLSTDGEPQMMVDILIEQRLNLIRGVIQEMRYKWKDAPLSETIPTGSVILMKSWQNTAPARRPVEVNGRVRWAALRTDFSWGAAAEMLFIAGVVTMIDLGNFSEFRSKLCKPGVTPALLEELYILQAWSLMNKERTQHGHSVPHP